MSFPSKHTSIWALFVLISNLHCLVGGFGAAKNLCTWAVEGKDCSVNDEVKAALQAFHSEGKAIGLCCISPVLAAKVFPGCEVTVGVEKDEK